jgi:hypothetical protein
MWNVSDAPMPPVRARSQPNRSDGKKTARRVGERHGGDVAEREDRRR